MNTQEEIHVVTGATGRTGIPMCLELRKRGLNVTALYRKESAATKILSDAGCTLVKADVTDLRSLIAAFSGATYIYHLAGVVSIETKPDKNLEDVNVTGTKNVLDAALSCKVKRIIYCGSVYMFPAPKKGVIEEPQNFDPNAVPAGNARTKAEAANILLNANGIEVVIGMPSGIIGPYEYTMSNFGQMVALVASGKMNVTISGRYDFVDARDVAVAFADLAEKGADKNSYLITGNTATVKSLINTTAKYAGHVHFRPCIPFFLARMFAPMMERHALKHGQKPTISPRSLSVLKENCNFSHAKLSSITGYRPRPTNESLRDHVEFYNNINK